MTIRFYPYFAEEWRPSRCAHPSYFTQLRHCVNKKGVLFFFLLHVVALNDVIDVRVKAGFGELRLITFQIVI